jgi:hypothetical protein
MLELYPRALDSHYLEINPEGDDDLETFTVEDVDLGEKFLVEVLGTIDRQDIIMCCRSGFSEVALRLPWPKDDDEAVKACEAFFQKYVPFMKGLQRN